MVDGTAMIARMIILLQEKAVPFVKKRSSPAKRADSEKES